MNKKSEQPKKEPEEIHKDQVLKTILIPVVTTTAICLAGCLFLVISSSAQAQSTEQWANISIMFLLVPTIFIGLIGLILLILLGRLTGNWNKSLPPSLRRIRLTAIRINRSIESAAQKPAKPFIGLKSTFAGIKAVFRK